MKPLPASLRLWSQDVLLRRVLKNSGYLFSSNSISAALSMVQSAYAAHLLGIDGFGLLGVITTFSATVNRLCSFRMSELVITYAGAYLAEQKPRHAAAVVKAAALAETLISLVAYLVLFLLAPLAAAMFAHDPSAAPLIIFYGLSILGNITAETATGVLQIGDHYRGQAVINLFQSILTAGVIVAAYYLQAGMMMVLWAYLLGKIILGMGPVILALRRMPQMFGHDWWKAPFSLLPPGRELRRFAISTNLSATVNLVIRDSEVLWIGLFIADLTVVGYYKAALAIINMVQIPIVPLINTTFPEIRKALAGRQWERLNDLLRRMTLMAGAWTGLVGVGLVLVGHWVIQFLYGAESLPAYPAMLTLLIGFGFANVFFWNRSLILSLGDPVYPLKVTLWTGLAKVLLAFLLVPIYGYVAEAALLSGYFVISIGLIVRRGLSTLRQVHLERVVEVQP